MKKPKRKSMRKASRPSIRSLMKELKLIKGGSGAATHGVHAYGDMNNQTAGDNMSNFIKVHPPMSSAGMAPPVEMKGGGGGGGTFNMTFNLSGLTDRTDKRQLAREIGNMIQQEVARSVGGSTMSRRY